MSTALNSIDANNEKSTKTDNIQYTSSMCSLYGYSVRPLRVSMVYMQILAAAEGSMGTMLNDDRGPVVNSDGVTARVSNPRPTWGMLPIGVAAGDEDAGLAAGRVTPSDDW